MRQTLSAVADVQEVVAQAQRLQSGTVGTVGNQQARQAAVNDQLADTQSLLMRRARNQQRQRPSIFQY